MARVIAGQPQGLPPLREELTLLPGPRQVDGAPTWTLHDPASNRFFRIGWREFEVLSRWHLGEPSAIAEAVNTQTTLTVSANDIGGFAEFLGRHSLLRMPGVDSRRFLEQAQKARRSPWATLLHNYLFFRVPLFHPHRFLARIYPRIAWIYSGYVALTLALLALIGLYLISRQWERFIGTFLHFFDWSGLVYYAAAISAAKIVHELGHAFTAFRYGCRIPTMGVAFMVMWPMLYTDVGDAWQIVARRPRLAIAGAGVAAETGLAAVCTLLWSFLPDGPVRSAAFLLATSGWLLTLGINLNPFMRLDGYYLLADWLGVDNLQPRSFAYTRWHLRRLLFGIADAPPERLPARRARFFIVYAWCTWLYRFFLFLGIALLVYHFFFKLAGLLLMLVEVGWFVALPVARELLVWRRLPAHAFNARRTRITWACAVFLSGLLLVPWRTGVQVPALLKVENYAEIFVRHGARLDALLAGDNQRVTAGQPLAVLSSADLDYKLDEARQEVDLLQWQLAYFGLELKLMEQRQVLLKQLETSTAKLSGFQEQRRELTVQAPMAGVIRDVSDQADIGQWLGEGERLMVVVDPDRPMLEAYIAEDELLLIKEGAPARFYPDDPSLPPVNCHVIRVDHASAAALPPYFASLYEGPLPVRPVSRSGSSLVPETAVYRLILKPDEGDFSPTGVQPVIRGAARVEGVARSLLERVWRQTVAVLIRESGF
ncbi:HlyD family efflux transporter periplasmic adaptor subunit [Methylocaldum sp.]|uniref:HlyD family efflux transporter periplasmic adaptor subunit n=1 Tax=Methylocaldum sp. TaxID=1969727 RepID=UPI002D5A8FC7|nr:HlyD family efflux transporter periplasmic adaptor subunit [Methylocaldum sp.]HYE36511.1 HlyD family efflux transporter periplasmic adaptor subunit [Methylocaldum sp.]